MAYLPDRMAAWWFIVLTVISLSLSLSVGQVRVIGGTDANANSAPFIVSLQYKGVHYCAGSIINSNWIITAAHCLLSSEQVKGTTLVAGTIYIADTAVTIQKRKIDHHVTNNLYIGSTSPYDVGLVYTKKSFIWTNAVRPIDLPSSTYKAAGRAVLYGWGSTSQNNNPVYPAILQMATVSIISLSECEKIMGDVHNTNLCTGPVTGGVGICTSDSGGPLVQNANGKKILIGIVSWGKLPCGQTKSASVYVEVTSVLTWIKENQILSK